MRDRDEDRGGDGGGGGPDRDKYAGHGGKWRVGDQRRKWKVLEEFTTGCVEAVVKSSSTFHLRR